MAYRLLIESFTRPDRNRFFASYDVACTAAEAQTMLETVSCSVFNNANELVFETHTVRGANYKAIAA